jgi:hypothetical protein
MTSLRRLRLQVMFSEAELSVIDDFRFTHRMPTRAAAAPRIVKTRSRNLHVAFGQENVE